MKQFQQARSDEPQGLAALAGASDTILDAIPAAILIVDIDGHIVRANSRARVHWAPKPLPDAPLKDLLEAYEIHENGRRLAFCDMPVAQALQGGVPTTERELEFVRPDGSRAVFLVNCNPVHDDQGRRTGAVCCFQDVTETALARTALNDSLRDLEDFFENGAVGLHLVAGDGTILRANRAKLAMLGYTREEYIGRSIRDFHADQDVISDILERLARGEQLVRQPARLLAKDGSIRHVLITSNANFRDGVFRNSRCFTVDVTDWRHSQVREAEAKRRLAATYEAAPVGIAEVDAEGRLLQLNGAFERIFGYSRAELLGRPFPEIAGPEEPTETDCPLEQATDGDGSYTIVRRLERRDGSDVFIRILSSTVRDENGRMQYGVRIVEDVTERKRAEDEQRTLIDELNHRVKNTLATVQSIAAQTMRSTPEDFARTFESRLMALSAAHNLLTRRRWTGVGLGELVDSQLGAYACDDGRLQLGGPEITLSPRVGVLLGMLLHELATNAVKYGALSRPEGTVRLTWSVERDGADRRHLRLLWLEQGGPAVTPPSRRGFGTRLLERSVTLDLRGECDLRFAPGGVQCSLDLPLE